MNHSTAGLSIATHGSLPVTAVAEHGIFLIWNQSFLDDNFGKEENDKYPCP